VRETDLLIGLNPGGHSLIRRWDRRNFAKLGDALYKRYGAKVIIFGGPNEEDLAKEIVGMMETDPINLTAKTSFKELAIYVNRCDHIITNDTGIAHLAGAVGTKTIVICGPVRNGPYIGKGHLIIQPNLLQFGCGMSPPCSLCERIGKSRCMNAIDVDTILSLLEFQREETKDLRTPGLNVYYIGERARGKLPSYFPLERRRVSQGELGDEILRFASLNLWIRENNRLGFFEEEPLTSQEIESELNKHYHIEDLREGIDEAIRKIKRYQLLNKRNIDFLLEFWSEYEDNITRLDELNQIFKEYTKVMYEDIGSLFLLFNFLNPGDPSSAEWKVNLYRMRDEACKYLKGFLEGWSSRMEKKSLE
jgi:hypothetical protein